MGIAMAACWLAAVAAAGPSLRLQQDTATASVKIKGIEAPCHRIAPGKALTFSVAGATSIQVDVRMETSKPGKTWNASVSMDGAALSEAAVETTLESDAASDRGKPVTQVSTFKIEVPAGSHAFAVAWPSKAPGDALVALRDVGPVADSDGWVSFGGNSVRSVQAVGDRTASSAAEATRSSSRKASSFQRWLLSVDAGGDQSAEGHTASSLGGRFGLGGGYRVTRELRVGADVGARLSQQEYLTNQLAPDGRGLTRTSVAERRYDAGLGASYDLGPRLARNGKLSLAPMAGVRFLAVTNEAFPANLFGAELGASVRYDLSTAVTPFAQTAFTFNLLEPKGSPVIGGARSLLVVGTGLSFPLAGGYALDVGYRGEFLSFAYDLRSAHGAAATFRASL